jgi:biotin carboxyl carrier protein
LFKENRKMKSYTITVNGNVYDVTVEENTNGAPAAAPAPRAAAPAPAPAAGAAGSISITAGAAGKVVDVVAAPGAAVKKGDPVVVLEIMKMETPVVAPQDGTVASVEVAKGETVESGAVLATMNA